MNSSDSLSCTSTVAAVRCSLYFSDHDKPKAKALQEALRPIFPVRPRCSKPALNDGLLGFRPKDGLFNPSIQSFAWQDGSEVYLQTESDFQADLFMKLIDLVLKACESAQTKRAELFQMEMTITTRFEFTPCDFDLLELHRYFNIINEPSSSIREQGLYPLHNHIHMKYGNFDGDLLELYMNYPARGPEGLDGSVDLTLSCFNALIPSQPDALRFAIKAMDMLQRVTWDLTTEELRNIVKLSAA